MNKKIISLLCVIAFIGGCASSKPSKRPDYTGEDSITAVNPSMILGEWNTRILNPIEGEETASNAIVKYLEDGSVVVDSEVDTGGMGVLLMEVSGTWEIKGESIEQVATDVREKSGSALGAVVKLFSGRMLKNANTTLNIFEASADRLVIVSDHGQAQELIRIK